MKNHHFKFAIVSLVLWTALSGCARKVEQEKPNAKADENIVTLTKANLEHVEIKTEPLRAVALSTTLRAPGRVSANLNKTAKVVATLEGRVSKLNFDLNDRVEGGDILGTVEAPELIGKPLELKAPIDGVMIERKVAAGELVDKSKQIYTISDPDRSLGHCGGERARYRRVIESARKRASVLAYPDELPRQSRSASATRLKRNRARSKRASKRITAMAA